MAHSRERHFDRSAILTRISSEEQLPLHDADWGSPSGGLDIMTKLAMHKYAQGSYLISLLWRDVKQPYRRGEGAGVPSARQRSAPDADGSCFVPSRVWPAVVFCDGQA